MKRKIYLATSWRNPKYPPALAQLRADGHDVYDFRANGFRWNELHPQLPHLSPTSWWNLLTVEKPWSGRAEEHFQADFQALNDADTVVQMLPSGRSASWETGYALGAGKDVYLYIQPDLPIEAELMALMFRPRVYLNWSSLRKTLLDEGTTLPARSPQKRQRRSLPPTEPENPPARG